MLLLLAPALHAQGSEDPHAVQPERPTVATHAFTVAPGWVELETGMELDRYSGGARVLGTPTNLKVGLARRVQLGILSEWMRNSGAGAVASGMGDFALAVKWRVADHLPVLGAFAVLPSLKLPTGSVARGTGTGTTDVGLLLISSHELGPASLDINVGYTRRSGDGRVAPRDATSWTAAAGIPVHGALGWTVETFGYPGTSGPAGQGPTVALLTGPTMLVRRWLEMDAGVIVRVAGRQPRALYGGGVWNIGKL